MIEYKFSKTLNMRYRIRKTELGMRLQTEDNVIYTESETALLMENDLQIVPSLHKVKKEFHGEIIAVN